MVDICSNKMNHVLKMVPEDIELQIFGVSSILNRRATAKELPPAQDIQQVLTRKPKIG